MLHPMLRKRIEIFENICDFDGGGGGLKINRDINILERKIMPLISYGWHMNLDAIMQEKRNSIALLTYFLH